MSGVEKELFDVVGWLEEKGIAYSTEGDNVGPGWVGIACAFCSDHANHLGINLSTKAAHCFKCKFKGDVIDVVKEVEGVGFGEALEIMQRFPTTSTLLSLSPPQQEERKARRKGSLLPDFARPLDPMHLPAPVEQYLERRKFRTSLITEHNLMYCALGYYSYRLIIPITLRGKMVSWQAADVTGKVKQKYLDCPPERAVVPVKHTLYGIDGVKGAKQVVIVEGVTDKWRMGREAVALFGKTCTAEQMRLLRDTVPRHVKIKVLLDDDASEEGRALAYALSRWGSVQFFRAEEIGRDPAQYSEREVREILDA